MHGWHGGIANIGTMENGPWKMKLRAKMNGTCSTWEWGMGNGTWGMGHRIWGRGLQRPCIAQSFVSYIISS
jgi:hypothetical protein